jgi:hypothetical protein
MTMFEWSRGSLLKAMRRVHKGLRVEHSTRYGDRLSDTVQAEFAEKLREKWCELPVSRLRRAFSSDLLKLPDRELLSVWEAHRGETSTPEVRGWYQERYRDVLRDKRVLDFGAGFSVDGVFFAENGAQLTFADIVADNLAVLNRIVSVKGISADFYLIDDFFRFHFSEPFDAILLLGSLHNVPFEFSRREIKGLLEFLRPGGLVLMLAYPRERYVRSGAKSFEEFGKLTDGERTPWCEWYDAEKVKALFGQDMKLQWSKNFGHEEIEFNWFELVKNGAS